MRSQQVLFMNERSPSEDPCPDWLVALIIFGVAGLGGPVLFMLLFWLL